MIKPIVLRHARSVRAFLLAFIVLFSTVVVSQPAQAGVSYNIELNKLFNPISIPAGGVSQLSISVFNSNPFPLTSVSWSDNVEGSLLAGQHLKLANPVGLINNCGGSVTATGGGALLPGGTTLALSGGGVPAISGVTPGQCTVTVNVTSITSGNLINNIPASNLSATGPTGSITNTTPASATLHVDAILAPTLSKTFGKHTLLTGEKTTLTLTIRNNDPTYALTGVSLIDNFLSPTATKITLADTTTSLTGCGSSPAPAITQADGTTPLAVNATSVRLNNGSIAANSVCTIVVDVKGDAAGSYTNTIPAGVNDGVTGIQTDQGVTNPSSATDNLNVQENVTKSFSPSTFYYNGGTSTLTITIKNPTGVDYTGVNLKDVLPTDGLTPPNQSLVVVGSPSTTCDTSPVSTATLAVGTTNYANDTLTLTNGTVSGTTGQCTITATVKENVITATPIYPTTFTNTIKPGDVNGGFTNSLPVTGSVRVVNTVSLPALSKSFGASPVWAGQVTTLTINIRNNDSTVTLTHVSLTDSLPTNGAAGQLKLANTTTSLTNCGAATLTESDGVTALSAGSTSLKINGATIAPSTTCRVVVNVVSDTQGVYNNTTGAFVMDQPGSPAPARASLDVREVAVTKSFSPTSFQAGSGNVSHLTITLYNPTSQPYTNASLTDILPANISFTGTPATTCDPVSPPATATVAISTTTNTNDTLKLNNGTIPAAAGNPSYPNTTGTCVITVDVTSNVASTYTNTIHPGDFGATTNNGAGHPITIPGNISQTVTVYPSGGGVTVSKTFTPSTISVPIVGPAGVQNSKMEIRIKAPVDTALTNFHITDTLPTSPAQVTVSNSSPATASGCGSVPPSGSMVLTATTGAASISLTGGNIAANSTCVIDVWVTSASNTRGAYTNTINPADLSGDSVNGTGTRTTTVPATATLKYQDAPAPKDLSVNKWFDSGAVNINGIATLHIQLQNANSLALINAALTDDLTTMGSAPNNVVIATPPNATNSCGGTVTAVAGGSSVSLANGVIPAKVGSVNGICEITVDVQALGSSTTVRTNTINASNVTAVFSGTTVSISPASNATAPLYIGGLSIAAVKGFNPLLVYANGVSTLSVQLINNNNTKLTGIKFVDNMPAGMFIANPANLNVGTCGGALTGAPGAASYSYSGGSLNPKSSCTLTLSATINVNGNLTNRIEAGVTYPALGVTSREGAKSPDPTDATLTNLPGASLSKLFSPNPIVAGNNSLLTITVTNTNGVSLSELGLVDTLPAGLNIAASPAPVNNCGGTLTAVAGTPDIKLNNDGALAALSNCTIVVSVTSNTPGSYLNCMAAGTLKDKEGATNHDQTCDTLKVVASSSNLKTLIDTNQSFTSGSDVAIGEIATYEVSAALPAGVGLSNVVMTDTMQKGLAYVDCLSVSVAGVDRTAEFCSPTATNPPTVNPITDPGDSSTNPANNGRQAVFNLGNVTNLTGADSNMVIRYRAVVLDVTENKTNSTLYNNALWTWGGASIPIEGPHLKVVEPSMTIKKSVDSATASLGSPVTFTLAVAHTANSAANAYNVVATDVLPSGLAFVPGSLGYTGLAPTSSTYDPLTTTLKFVWDVFPLSQSATITFQAVFVGPSPVINNTNLVWTSLPLDPVNGPSIKFSKYNDHSTERWYDPTDLTGLNHYGAQDSVSIQAILPSTGFAPGVVTTLPPQPQSLAYANLGDLWLEIPRLKVQIPIIGIPLGKDGSWDLTWLADQAGFLDGTAYPTHAGNSVLTAHVYMPNGQPGPFVNLGNLQWGDQIIAHLGGQKYIYQVRQNQVVSPQDVSILKHEELPWLTLLTCKDYDAAAKTYLRRVAVRAVLVKVEPDR